MCFMYEAWYRYRYVWFQSIFQIFPYISYNVPLVLVAFVIVDDADYANGVDVSKCMNLEPFFSRSSAM